MIRTEDIAEEIAVLMPIIARRVLLEFFQSVEITQTQIFTLMALLEDSPCRLSQLTEKLNIAAPTTTGIIDRLERAGYVKRFPDKKDRRVVNVDLTAKGLALAQKFRMTIKNNWRDILVKLSAADREKFLAILRSIQEKLP